MLLSRFYQNLFQKHLFATNVGISFLLSGLGDLLQQHHEQRRRQGQVLQSRSGLNLTRTLHMSVTFGLTSGFLCHFWYNFLDKFIPGSGVRIVIRKIAYDQIIFSPVCITSCLLVDRALESNQDTAKEVFSKGCQLYAADWILWPPAQFINFYFLPTKFRVIFDNMVSLVFDVYTSHVKYQIPAKEKLILQTSMNQ